MGLTNLEWSGRIRLLYGRTDVRTFGSSVSLDPGREHLGRPIDLGHDHLFMIISISNLHSPSSLTFKKIFKVELETIITHLIKNLSIENHLGKTIHKGKRV